MAALSDRLQDSLVPLRNVHPDQLDALLEEEIAEWRALHWDFRPSDDLVRRFAGMQALDGFALFAGPKLAGFAYTVTEDGKGLIGDLYVSKAHRTLEREYSLMEAALSSMWRYGDVRRVEAQLLMISEPLRRAVPFAGGFQTFARKFFEASLDRVGDLPARTLPGATIAPWSEFRHEEAARLIAKSYEGHIDGRINDQYRSALGARRFLTNIVQYPGCGSFYAPASFVALDRPSQHLCGISLASMVAEAAGHITQICVTPDHRGTGLGYELLRRSLAGLVAKGALTASLTVTADNANAIRLYEQVGFRSTRDFAAYVWEKR